MQDTNSITLARDCVAVQIPSGLTTNLPKGTTVEITQSLGGSYTVRTGLGLYRVDAKDADALGLTPGAAPAAAGAAAAGPLDEKQVWDILRTCFDPEIPVNIVDLGLVYDLSIETAPTGRHSVSVKMTLTAQGCGMGGIIAEDARQRILQTPGVEAASVEIVWDPPWHPSMITEEGRRILGMP